MRDIVTVVVPTYNRAHLLDETIPSYLQDEVKEIIVVDDASTDDTPDVLSVLANRFPGKIRFVRNDENRKQAFSKNRGKELANTPWIYFGDDDSVLHKGSIRNLLDTAQRKKADIVGAIALYCRKGESPYDALLRYKSQSSTSDALSFVDLSRLQFNFSLRPDGCIELPVAQASFIIRRELCMTHEFDTIYTHNCYREETDFLLCCFEQGAKIFLCGEAFQINLPPELATGGARSGHRIFYEWYSLINTWKFIRKHKKYFKENHNKFVPYAPLLHFFLNRCSSAIKKIII